MELLMVFVGGLLGSSHCVGMCGAFAISIGAATRDWRINLARQVIYSLGRVFTYSAAGAMVGFAGFRLNRELPTWVHIQSWLAVFAGMLLVIQGLKAAGVWRRLPPRGSRPACLPAGLFASFLKVPYFGSVFLAGMINGLLPCGLVYAFLTFAANTQSMLSGMTHMLLFGLGTVPIMVMTGCSGGLLSLASRRRLLHVSACCVIVTGVLSISRGIAFISRDAQVAAVSCPACTPDP
jgi:sulfite exporter TauE/SafE